MTYAAEVLIDSPLAYWRLGEPSGTTAADASGNANTGTYVGSPTLGVVGLLGGSADTAVAFASATDQHVESTTTFGAITYGAFTLECIINASSLAAFAHLCGFSIPGPPDALYLYLDGSGHVALNWQGTGSHNIVSGALSTATRYHIAATYDGTTFTLYVNGSPVATLTSADSPVLTVAQAFYAGNDGFGIGDGFDGVLDEVAFYNHALSGARIAAHYAFVPGHTIVLPFLDTEGDLFAPSIGKHTTPAGSSTPAYVVKLATMVGPVSTIADAIVEKIVWTKNQPDVANFSYPKGAVSPGTLEVLGTASGPIEIQIYHDGDLLFWGPIWVDSAAGSDGAVHCTCKGVDAYLFGRNLDAPIINEVTNGDFEADLADWSTSSTTATITTDNRYTGTKSVRLSNASDNVDGHLEQIVSPDPNGVGVFFTVSARFFIESYLGPAAFNLGLLIEGYKAGVLQANNPDPYFPIDNATARNKWGKAVASIQIPPNEAWQLKIKPYGVHGSILWDAIKIVAQDSFSTAGLTGSTTTPVDIGRILAYVVQVLQSSVFGKSNVRIGTNCELTGTKLPKTWFWVDSVPFGQALGELVERADGLDYRVEITPTTRTWHSYAGKMGTDRTGSVHLRFVQGDATSNLSDYRRVRDGTGVYTREKVNGEDSGPDRDIGEFADASAFAGLILQEVYQAPQGTDVDSLQPIAEERVGRYGVAPLAVEVDIKPDANLIHVLKTGDVVPLTITDDGVAVNEPLRVQQLALDAINNVLTATLVRDTL